MRTEFRAVSSCLLVGIWPGFVLFLLPLHSRRAAVDSEHVANACCCLVEDYHPITGWCLENALCCRASMGERPESECLIRKEMLRWGKPLWYDSCSISGIKPQKPPCSLRSLRIWFFLFSSFLSTFIQLSWLHRAKRVKWKSSIKSHVYTDSFWTCFPDCLVWRKECYRTLLQSCLCFCSMWRLPKSLIFSVFQYLL